MCYRWLLSLTIGIVALLLTACGGEGTAPQVTARPAELDSATEGAGAPRAPANAAQPTLLPGAQTVAPLPASRASPRPATPTPSAARTATPVGVPQADAQPVALFDGIPHGLTADGFPFLGAADAPVTLTDYSDFL